jgi:polyisoprenoid-binding protein YceI
LDISDQIATERVFERIMHKSLLFVITAALFLAACSSQPAPTARLTNPEPQAAEATSINPPAATSEPSAESAQEATATTQPAAPAAVVVYKIVPGESSLQYEVGETFINENNRFAMAVGVTPQVSGEITIDHAAPQNSQIGTITADISQFKSDSTRRDNALRDRFIESSRYPNVTFVPTQVEGLPGEYQDGQEIPLEISGDLTIREVTRPVTFDAVVRLEGNQLTGQAVTTILMSDFQFGPISIGGILNTEDEAKVTLNLVARP